MGVPAGRSVLGRRSVAQGRVMVSVVVFVFEVADHEAGLELGVPVVALRPSGAVEHDRIAATRPRCAPTVAGAAPVIHLMKTAYLLVDNIRYA
jgi:hypothetical protein